MTFVINGITVHVKDYTDHLLKNIIHATCVNNSAQQYLYNFTVSEPIQKIVDLHHILGA